MKWQTEAMYRRYEAGRGADQLFPVAETFHDWGMYSQVVWGFKKGWTAGVRGDYLHMQDSAFTDDPIARAGGGFPAISPGIRPSFPRSGCSTTTIFYKRTISSPRGRRIRFSSSSNSSSARTARTNSDALSPCHPERSAAESKNLAGVTLCFCANAVAVVARPSPSARLGMTSGEHGISQL